MKAKKGELLLARAFIDQNIDRIIDWCVGDVWRCCNLNQDGSCRDEGALDGAFILWCCAIDYFGGLFTGITSVGGTETRMREFINKYMHGYDSKKVSDLRWSLLHFYSPHHFLLYQEGDEQIGRVKHLKIYNASILLHLGCSAIDLKRAVSAFKSDLLASDDMKIKIWRYYQAQPPIMPVIFDAKQLPVHSSLVSETIAQNITASGTIPEITWVK